MAPHTGLRLGYLFLSPFAYEPVRWLKLAKAPAVKPEFKSCGRDRRSESSLPSCPLSSALHRRVHAFASAPMKRISTCQSPPHRLPNISFYHESLYSFLKTQHRGLHCPSSAGFQASSHAFLALPTGCFLTALGPQPALLWSLISASHVVITQDMCIELHTRRKRCTPIWSME